MRASRALRESRRQLRMSRVTTHAGLAYETFKRRRTLALNALGGNASVRRPRSQQPRQKVKPARRSRQLGEATVRKLNGDASVAHGCD
jgi:hypothetical protein